ncbi:MAG: DUF1329 domain-containing protein [Nevskiaceae bacterium]|nr:MAG: DUF1329 domain-containing protein [Nevskiaceae bacterium]
MTPRSSLRGIACGAALMAALACVAARADQYHSEVRELDTTPQPTPQQDPQKLLQTVTDPYAKSMLLRDLAAQAVAKKDYAGAARYLEQALKQNGLSGPAVEQMKKDLSQIYLATGNYKDMIPQLEAQLKAGNAATETLIALGAAYVDKKRFKEAVPLLQKGIAASKTPDLSWKRALLAALLGSGQDKDALPLAEQVVHEDPTHGDDWLRLAALNLKAGNRERARAVMEIASRLGFLTTEDDRLRLVTLTAQLGAPFEGASTMQQWMDGGQIAKTGGNWKTLAAMWINARETSLAVPALEQAILKAPSAELYQQLAQMRMYREQYAEAAQALQQAVAMGAKSGPVLMTLGMARYQQADVDGALQAFSAAQAYPASRKLAEQWVRYLQSGKARDQALAAAKERRAREDNVTLSARLLGGTVALGAGEGGGATEAKAAQSGALTPVGADQAGNADGSIPAWTGGIARAQWPPAVAGGRVADPFPGDKPLFTITPANMAQYRERLSKGHLALLTRYGDYSMPVYPARRSVGYPQAIYDATQANIGKARLSGSDALEGARLGFPFPKPQNGVEIMWNHRVRFRGNSMLMQSTQAVVRPDGGTQLLKQTERVLNRYANLKNPSNLSTEKILLYYLTWFGKTKADIDFLALVHESANSLKQPRNIWVAPPKIPKMFRIPPVGYDQPFPGAEGIQFIDMVDMYNGAFDRYVWKLTGKHELYLPYNSYRIGDGRYKYDQLLTPKHFYQPATRYELHRVWVIEATEREGKKHSFGKRVFYVDEDSWNVVLVENYDRDGNLWRFQEGHLLPVYTVQAANCAPVITYDLKDGRYFINRLLAEDVPPQFDLPMTETEFNPDGVRARYVH